MKVSTHRNKSQCIRFDAPLSELQMYRLARKSEKNQKNEYTVKPEEVVIMQTKGLTILRLTWQWLTPTTLTCTNLLINIRLNPTQSTVKVITTRQMRTSKLEREKFRKSKLALVGSFIDFKQQKSFKKKDE